MTIAPPNPPFIAARWHGGAQTPKRIVLHSTVGHTETGSARAVARFFATEDNKTSAHYVVDEGEVIQCVGDHTVAYHCGHNQDSIGVEMCECPSLTWFDRWLIPSHIRMRRRTQRLVARLCVAYDIPARFLTVDRLLAGERGITTHNNMSLAYKQSSHWDPGVWPKRLFMRAVRKRIAELTA